MPTTTKPTGPQSTKSSNSSHSTNKLNAGEVLRSKELASIQKVLILAASFLVVIIGLQYIAEALIAPILLAIFYTVLMYPLFKWFRNRGYRSSVSVLLMVLTLIVVVVALAMFMTWSFSLLQEAMPNYLASFQQNLTATTEALGIDEQTTQDVASFVNPQAVVSLLNILLQSASTFVYYFVIIPILSIMILLQIDSFPKASMEKMAATNPNVARLGKFASSITRYVFARLQVNLITGGLLTVALYILGIDYALVWGILAVFLSFIPYIGLVIAAIPPVLLGFASGGLPLAAAVAIATFLINFFAENVVEPVIVSTKNKISMAAVVISLIFWTWLFGFIGAILATPLTVLLKIVLADYKETAWLVALIEGDYQEMESTKDESKGQLQSWMKRWAPSFSKK